MIDAVSQLKPSLPNVRLLTGEEARAHVGCGDCVEVEPAGGQEAAARERMWLIVESVWDDTFTGVLLTEEGTIDAFGNRVAGLRIRDVVSVLKGDCARYGRG